MFTFNHFINAIDGKVVADNNPGRISHFLTDSRKLINPKESVFVAICGIRNDGHDFIEDLYRRGVRKFVVENQSSIRRNMLNDSSVVLVKCSLKALQQIATVHRKQFNYPVIAITGSNGKTIIKEWLGQLLENKFKIIKSPKSYNSQLGVPLSVLQMGVEHNLAIFEAGISTKNEMQKLEQVIDPSIGIFTNIGTAHDEGFRNQHAKILEKWKLFYDCATVIYCEDHKPIVHAKPDNVHGFSWGHDDSATVKISSVKKYSYGSALSLNYYGETLVVNVPFVDDASLENAMHCITTMLLLGMEVDEINESLSRLSVVEMRLELKKGINNCYLIDDSYNNDLGGLQVAIDFLKNQPGKNYIIIISDILQSGLTESTLCEQLNDILRKNQIRSMIGIGPILSRNKSLFSLKSTFYESTEHFLQELDTKDFQDATILIKGARAFGFERISNVLSEKIHRTVLEINLDAINHNLNFYKSKINDAVKLMVMVKAAAYGNGSAEIASLLQFNRVDYLAVAYADEGVELRRHGIELPIMVMNVAYESFRNLVRYNLEPEIYSLHQLQGLIAFGLKEKPIKIHIKIDTGMHRLGFEEGHIDQLIDTLKHNPAIEVASIYSHLAGADEAQHNDFSNVQVSRFLDMARRIEKGLNIQAIKHILNSAGILRFPDYQLDMVRLGIGLYGFEANQQSQGELQAVSTLKTVISQIKHVPKGQTIGYGRKGVAKRDSQIATIAIGYADGFSRAFSNGKISLMVRGAMAPVIGNICMDMCMLDVTGIDAREGDEVLVFGKNPSIKQLADAIDTIPYEILTGISSRVTRVFYTS